VAKVRERLTVNKQCSYIIHVERVNLNKLNKLEGKEQYHVEISYRFTELKDLDTNSAEKLLE
jgi:hypothetical protein